MMPNLGQGGCQAIEDGFVLTDLLCTIDDKSQLKGVLQEYYRKRIVRSAIIQGMSRLSSDIIITSFSTPFKLSGKISGDLIRLLFVATFYLIKQNGASYVHLISSHLITCNFLLNNFYIYFQHNRIHERRPEI